MRLIEMYEAMLLTAKLTKLMGSFSPDDRHIHAFRSPYPTTRRVLLRSPVFLTQLDGSP